MSGMIVTTLQCLICDAVWQGEAAYVGEAERVPESVAAKESCPECGCSEVTPI